MPQRNRLPGIQLRSLFSKFTRDQMRERKVHIVAADQHMFANSRPLQDQFTSLLLNANEFVYLE